MNDRTEIEVDEQPRGNPPGSRLHHAREAAGLSQQAVAARLHLGVEIVDALERDEYGNLPAAIFVRGYLRSYAGILDLPADELVEAYNLCIGAERPPQLVVSRAKREVGSGDRRMRYATFLIAALLVGLVTVWWYNQALMAPYGDAVAVDRPSTDKGKTATSAGAAAGTPSLAQAGSGPGAAAGSPEHTVRVPASVSPESRGGAAGASSATPVQPPVPEATAPVPVPTEQAQGHPQAAAPPPSDVLTLRFKDASWAEVRDARDKRLMFGLGKSGDTDKLTGKAPFRVLLGNSPAVDVEINGKPFDQSSYNTRGKTARFEVGG